MELATEGVNCVWCPLLSKKCPRITAVRPPHIQRTTARYINLTIEDLPVGRGKMFCVFRIAAKDLSTIAERSSDGLTCATPHISSIPPIPPEKHYITAELSVKTETGLVLVDPVKFVFYDCSSYQSCTECVSSPFICHYCVEGYRCTHKPKENCRNDILVTSINSSSTRSGPAFCPRILPREGSSNEIIIPSGHRKRVYFKVESIPIFVVTSRFACQFDVEGRVQRVTGQLLGDTIYCDTVQFSYEGDQPYVTVPVGILWDGNKFLDNPQNIHLIIYRCENMADNCGKCLELTSKYSCGWCSGTNSCKLQDECSGENSSWLNGRDAVCTDPEIIKFYPQTGPVEGGTNITIVGINLGRSAQDIVNGVSVILDDQKQSTVPCIVHTEEYVKTNKIVCQVDIQNLESDVETKVKSGPVEVSVLNMYSARTRQRYTFVNPVIESIFPNKGPRSGGTLLNLKGRYMNAGNRIRVFVGDLPCNVVRRNMEVITCLTSPSKENKEGRIVVNFDNAVRFFDKTKYEYIENPTIHSVESIVEEDRKLGIVKCFTSGDDSPTIVVTGENLDTVQRPSIYAFLDNKEIIGVCEVTNASEMSCMCPTVPKYLLHRFNDEEPIELDFGFNLDGIRIPLFQPSNFPEFHVLRDSNSYSYREKLSRSVKRFLRAAYKFI